MSASANTMLADLPPSSSVTRLIVAAADAAIRAPTSVEPVNATFATSGCSTSRAPAVEPGPATTLTTPSGIPASSAIFSNSSAVSGVSSAGLRTTVLPAASAGAIFHDAMFSGKFHGVISATTPSGSRNVIATPPDTGIVSPRLRSDGARVVAEHVGDHAHLAARVADRLAGVARLEHRQLFALLGQRVGEPVQQPRAVGRGDRAPRRDRRPWREPTAASASSTPARGQLGQDLLGRRLYDRQHPPTATRGCAGGRPDLGVDLVDRAARAREPVPGARQPPDPDRDEDAERHDRGVVEQRPLEVALPRHAGRAERGVEVDDHDDHHLDDRDDAHPLVLVAQRPRAGLERVAHPPAQEDRDDCRPGRGRSRRSTRPR